MRRQRKPARRSAPSLAEGRKAANNSEFPRLEIPSRQLSAPFALSFPSIRHLSLISPSPAAMVISRVSRSGPVPVLTPFKPGPGPVAGLDRLPHGRTGTRTAIDRTCVGPQSGLGPGPVRTVVAVQTGQNRFGLVLDQSSVTQTPGVRRAGQGAGADMPPGKQGSRQVRRQIVQRAAATRHQ